MDEHWFQKRYTRWFKYDRDDLCVNKSQFDRDDLFVNKSQFVPVIFEPPCILRNCVAINAQNFKVANRLVRKCITSTPVRVPSRYN